MKTTPQTSHTPKGTTNPRHRSRFIFLEIASYKRCSRPLCSSQTTTPYHTPHTHPPRRTRQPCDRCSQETRNKQTPHHRTPRPVPPKGNRQKTRRHGPVASGPNSVPNTKPPVPSQAPFQDHHPQGRVSVLGAGKNRRPLFVDIPPVSTRRRTSVCATGVLLTTPPHSHT